ncbi:MAG: amidohydrolase family protein [Isosphaeraceae bacterium]
MFLRRRSFTGKIGGPARLCLITLTALLAHAGASASEIGQSPEPPSARADDKDQARFAAGVVLKGGTLIDGTGAPARRADVALNGDRIVAVGSFAFDPKAKVIDISSLCIAPGFIDLHNHSDSEILRPGTRLNANYLTQGVTTIVTGNCGKGALDVAKYLAVIDGQGAGTNVIHLVPHGTLRAAVLGNAARPPSPSELDRMKRLLDRGLDAGAWGFSTGLIYVPSRYADRSELIELAKVARRHGGLYASHIRNEGARLLESIDEAIAIGQGAGVPVHISHLKASGKGAWGTVGAALGGIALARKAGQAVTADQYPYTASSTQLAAMVVPHWAIQGSAQDFAKIAADNARGAALRREIQQALDDRGGGSSIRIARYAPRPAWAGLDLAAIAAREKTTPLEIVLQIQRRGGAQAISFGMCEPDVREVMRSEFVATASDGAAHLPGRGDRPHPRSYGTFPRKLRYALDEKVLTIEQAIRSCTGWPAEILGLPDRGLVRQGAVADIVVFDPKTFRDAATFDEPTRYASGVEYLFVSGVPLIARGRLQVEASSQAKLPGRALRLHRDGPADLIVKVKRIWTGDPANPWAEAIAARGGAIAAVGKIAEVMAFRGPSTRVIDRPGAFALPGLIDAHGHMEALGASHDEIDLRGIASLTEVARRVKERIEARPGDSWITGRNWDQSLWPGGEFPTAAVLDAVAPTRPVWLERVDGHAGWANAEGMRRAKVTRDTQAPQSGQIIRGPAGMPTGVFVDGAMSLVQKAVPEPSRADVKRRLLTAQRLVLEAGLTCVHDAGISRRAAEIYREIDRAGQLVARIYGMALPPEGNEAAFVSQPPQAASAAARFELRAIKLFIDGAMGSRGALLFEPYHDDPANSGLLLLEPKRLEEATKAALQHGWQVCTHAIGDKGNALVLEAYAAARKAVPQARDPRLRIEHAQVVRKDDVARFAALGVIASMQPSHASDDMRWADARLGPGRADGAYAWRWFMDAKVPLACGSDFPVEIVNPFWGIYAGITRQDAQGKPAGGWHPDQLLTLEETLRGFTAGAAHAAFADDRLGILKTGFRADVTVVDRDLFEVKPNELLATRVLGTIVDGRVAFERERP